MQGGGCGGGPRVSVSFFYKESESKKKTFLGWKGRGARVSEFCLLRTQI